MASLTDRDLLVKNQTNVEEVLRRLDNMDKQLVPRSEYSVTIKQLTEAHVQNQKDIERMQKQISTLIWKVSGALGTLQVVSSIIIYHISKGI